MSFERASAFLTPKALNLKHILASTLKSKQRQAVLGLRRDLSPNWRRVVIVGYDLVTSCKRVRSPFAEPILRA